ncbi:MAG: gas vesicle protein [Deinococcota bacterium]
MTSPSSRRSSSTGTNLNSSTLADILERVLDKGVVIAGDITVTIGEVELLSIKIRLIIASVDKAKEMGIDWWRTDQMLSSLAAETGPAASLEQERKQLALELENERLRAELTELKQRRLATEIIEPDTPEP